LASKLSINLLDRVWHEYCLHINRLTRDSFYGRTGCVTENTLEHSTPIRSGANEWKNPRGQNGR
ncbi:MAG: hypothetical protein OXE92_00155, partial [Bacteroidetes bacterium]|nr:hypothetical protein [Bacteroidota bacterium]